MNRTSTDSQRQPWQPMRLQYVGHVGDLMQGGTGSRTDGGNVGFDKGVGGGGGLP